MAEIEVPFGKTAGRWTSRDGSARLFARIGRYPQELRDTCAARTGLRVAAHCRSLHRSAAACSDGPALEAPRLTACRTRCMRLTRIEVGESRRRIDGDSHQVMGSVN